MSKAGSSAALGGRSRVQGISTGDELSVMTLRNLAPLSTDWTAALTPPRSVGVVASSSLAKFTAPHRGSSQIPTGAVDDGMAARAPEIEPPHRAVCPLRALSPASNGRTRGLDVSNQTCCREREIHSTL